MAASMSDVTNATCILLLPWSERLHCSLNTTKSRLECNAIVRNGVVMLSLFSP
jgi:hypothetical protein